MSKRTFFCVDAHTCGNPVRVVAGGGPVLKGDDMSARRQYFIEHYDWIRQALMFEPRGHDMMSGAILYPPINPDSDVALLFIETSGCLPMCGHGTIGTVTAALEHGHISPHEEGRLKLDVPAGQVLIDYVKKDDYVESVRIYNVASYLAASDIIIDCPGLGELSIDVAYGGNYYAIVDPQTNFTGLETFSANDVLRFSPVVRSLVNDAVDISHPEDKTISGVSHVMWTGKPQKPDSHGRNAVFYGDNAIDRSPCGTGTSARLAQLVAKAELTVGDEFVHESIIGNQFIGRVESVDSIGKISAIRPSIQGWAQVIGLNTIFVDDRDPYAHGFKVK